MKAHPRRDFLLRVLAACGTPLVVPGVGERRIRRRRRICRIRHELEAAAEYFGAGVEAARTIGEAYLRQINVEPTRASILEHTGGAVQILAAARTQKAALTELVGAVRRDFRRAVSSSSRDGWCRARKSELCALTLLPASI